MRLLRCDHIVALSIVLLAMLNGRSAFAELTVPRYQEPYRPGFHFSPETNWTNEPNGLIYHEGRYHIFYQANPFNNQFGNQSWGHATSPDLVHWEQKPVAIPPDGNIMTYSGTAVFDVNNTSGLGTAGKGPLVAAYTGWNAITGIQDQRLAYSNDSGETWTTYAGNPVLDVNSNEMRDPKVFWHSPTQKWKMITSHGGQKKLQFYESTNLKSWTYKSDFTDPALPSSINGWEVPDIFELAVDGNPANKKHVLSMTPATGSPAGGNGVLYWIGNYNGTHFTSSNAPGTALWADYGRDFDGQQSWSNMPDGRTVWTSIMQSYGESVPTTPWRGQMAFPRELSLKSTSDGIRLFQKPIDEIQSLRVPGQEIVMSNVSVSPGVDPLDALNLNHDMFEIIATIDPQTAQSFGFNVREGIGGQRTALGWNNSLNQMIVDRRSTGNTSFDGGAGGVHAAPLTRDNGRIKLHALVDRNSVELFGNDGRVVISDLIFPDPNSRGISLFAGGGTALFETLEIYPLRSIWPTFDPPAPGTNVVAHWSMDSTPWAAAGGGLNPATIDRRTANGEGTRLGTTNRLYEPDPAVDNLYSNNQLLGVGGPFTTSSQVPPVTMFANGNNGGGSSYNADAIRNVDGALYLPADKYGNDMAFDTSFTVEMFFKTHGNQSSAGNMQLMLQGEDSFRYGIIVNEGGPGNVRFAINDKAGTIPLVDMSSVTATNYADGAWHYLVAEYSEATGPNGELTLTIVNEDGSFDVARTIISPAFDGLPSGGDGNMLIGRENYSLGGGGDGNPRTFRGLIDEVQITNGAIAPGELLGVLPSLADFDGNGEVNGTDLIRWQSNFGTSTGADRAMGDADRDGDVDGRDFLLWQKFAGFGQQSLTASLAVPEPGSHVWGIITLLLLNRKVVSCFPIQVIRPLKK